MRKKAGFTLQEIMIVVVIIGIMGGLVAMPYRRTIERSRWRAARDVLEAVYAGEQVYWTMNGNKYCSPSAALGDPVRCPCTGPAAEPQCLWNSIYIDDPTVGVPINYVVTVPGDGTFTATATRQIPLGGDACYNWSVSINNLRQIVPATPGAVC